MMTPAGSPPHRCTRTGSAPGRRAGSTLLELVVALAVLAIAAAVAGVAMRAPAPPDPAAERASRVAALRRTALEERRAVHFVLPGGAEGVALPDGRVLLADTAVDPLTGRPRARR